MIKNIQEKTPQGKEPQDVESEIERLKRDLAEKEKALKEQKEIKPEAETLKPEKQEQEEVTKAEEKKETSEAPKKEKAPEQLSPRMNDPEILKELTELKESGQPRQVIELAYLAFEKGTSYALDIANKTKDPSIIAGFRGILTSKLGERLKEKNKL
ncbi:MAG: hypothetical protein PHN19_00470 [Patescibacteria group bacterium]|nr:hypothetical protein [Patescibacteria group bacterium]